MIRHARPNDAAAICAIYNHYVLHTTITFEEIPVVAGDMEQRIATVQEKYPWLVYEEDGRIIGYAYAGQWKPRSAYKHTVETSVYLDPEEKGKGIGRQLYSELIAELRKTDIHGVIGGIALPNEASIRLHESMGFKKIGQFIEVGYKFNTWVDVGYWELVL